MMPMFEADWFGFHDVHFSSHNVTLFVVAEAIVFLIQVLYAKL